MFILESVLVWLGVTSEAGEDCCHPSKKPGSYIYLVVTNQMSGVNSVCCEKKKRELRSRQHCTIHMQIATTFDSVMPTCSSFVQGKTTELAYDEALAYDEGCSN